jgi:outer membrane protein
MKLGKEPVQNMFRSSILKMLGVCAVGLACATVVSAQAKIGVINFQRAITETAEIKKAQSEMALKYKPRQDAIDKAQRELNDIQTQLQSSQGKLSPAGEAELQARGQRKQREAQRLADDLQADVDRDRNDILQRAAQRMTDVVKKLGDEKGLDLVVDSASAVSYKPALDITNDAVAAYDKAHPAK